MSAQNRRRRIMALAAGLVVLAVGAAVAANRSTDTSSGAGAPSKAPLASARVTRQTLNVTDETTATLTFVSSATVSAPVAGTVTRLPARGDTIGAGTVVATVDGSPLVALFGDLPPWRDLSTSSTDGADIYQLELNLVALGFDPDAGITIDEHYDTATAAAVNQWRTSLGLDSTGTVPQSLVAYVPGQILVDTVNATVGGGVADGGPLVSGRLTERALYVPTVAAGVVSNLAAPGTPVATGTRLFNVSGYPVVAIEGDAATLPLLSRKLAAGVSAGADVKLLEQMLTQLGFDDNGRMAVDDTFNASTASAVAAWYASLGLTPPNLDMVPAGSFVVVPSGLQAGTALLSDGTDPGHPIPVLTLTAPARVVTTTAPLGDATFKVGATVSIELPDTTTVPGTVTAIGLVATNPTGQPGAQATVPITIQVGELPGSVDGFVEVPVTLRVVTQSIPDAYVVPTSALLALSEGGYALEVTDGSGGSHLIAIEAGVFVDGFVQVSGPDLRDGLQVAVPS
jgi:membrane fusion protein, multidrug efflux system